MNSSAPCRKRDPALRRRLLTLVAGLAMALGLAGCPSSSDTASNSEDASGADDDDATEQESGSDYGSEPRAPLDLGTGVVFDAPTSWQLRSPLTPTVSYPDCTVQAATVEAGADFTEIEFLLVGAGCTDSHVGLNGSWPDFVRPDLVPEARNVVAQRVDLGQLTLLTEPYTECGGECVDFLRRVAFIEMTKPTEQDFPTLVIYTAREALDDEVLKAMVDGISLDQP